MRVDFSYYNQRPLMIQLGALRVWGVYITEYATTGAVHQLYNLMDFYVEVVATQDHRPYHAEAFRDTQRLTPFLTHWQKMSS